MKKTFFLTALLSVFLLGAKDQILIRQPQECFIGLHDNQVWQLPPWDGKGRVVVSFEQRLDFPRLGGWTPCWQILVNDRRLSAMADRNSARLLNKGLTAVHCDYGISRVCKDDKWYALYSPDYEQAITKFLPANLEAYKIKLDISDVLSRQEQNSLRIRFGAELEGYFRLGGIKRRPALAIRNITFVQEDTPTALKPAEQEKDFVQVRELPRPDFSCTDGKNGLAVTFGGQTYTIRSAFSIPGERTKTITVGDDNPFYTVTRKLDKKENRIDIFDTFTSKTDKLIGLRIAYEMDSKPFPKIYLAGDSSPSRSMNQDGRNPSVFFPDPKHGTGLGLLAQDDVFRVQNVQYCEKGKAGIKTETFALSPGESRTVEWSVYPVRSEDYFDFVNEVRKDWQVNFTIPGQLHLSMNVFRDWQKEPWKAVDFHRKNGITMNVYGVHYWRYMEGEQKNWNAAVFGPAIMKEKSRANVGGKIEPRDVEPLRMFEKSIFETAKKIMPDLKRLYYIHTQWSTEVDDYQTYADSALRTKDGKFYTGIEEPYHFFIPTLNNSFGKAMQETLDKIFQYYDPDGIYIDESTCSPLRLSYDMWDKVSVELDRNNNVKNKIGYVTLLKMPFMMKLYDKIINEHHKILIANFGPETKTERQFHFPRFEETCNSWWIFYSHLYTPIQLGDVSTYGRTPEENMADIRNAMKNGALYYHYLNTSASPTITQKMFPFTPIEIHSKWLVGKERILTCVSGDFGWHGGKNLAEIFVYDKFGKSTGDYSAEFFADNGDVRVRLHLRDGQCAVILPIGIEADFKGDVRLLEPRYENGVFSCKAAGNGSIVLKKGNIRQTITVNQPNIQF
ncbi:MAG: hypothetical protein IJH79_17800 [Lentisphaeria bacterium]|nr:hypothetical protein [Lentisphaeria bacterium]